MCLFLVVLKGQSIDSTSNIKKENKQDANFDTTGHKVLGDRPEIINKGDTTRIKLGKKNITIIKEENGKTTVQIDKLDEDKNDSIEESEQNKEDYADKDNDFPNFNRFHKNRESHKFNPHWGGLELTLNNFMTSGFSMNLPKESRFLELNAGKSIGVRLNVLEYAIPISSRQGFATGLGLEFNSYYFDSDSNNIQKENGYIVPKMKPKDAGDYSKNKMKDTYLTIPLAYEIQFPLGNSKRPLYFSAGVIGGLNLGSTTKEYYQLNGEDKEDISSGNIYIAPLRFGYQVRLGYRRIHLVATYYQTTLFEPGKGPEVHPFDIGIKVLNW